MVWDLKRAGNALVIGGIVLLLAFGFGCIGSKTGDRAPGVAQPTLQQDPLGNLGDSDIDVNSSPSSDQYLIDEGALIEPDSG